MAILPIRHYPDPVLNKQAEPIDTITEEIKTLATNMVETMYAAPGVGLAAPQVGVSKNLIIIDCAPKDASELIIAVNPEIIAREGESFEEEGCLSVPGYYTSIARSAKVTVRYLDLEGQQVEREATGLLAIAFQHEIDHLEGILYPQRLDDFNEFGFEDSLPDFQ